MTQEIAPRSLAAKLADADPDARADLAAAFDRWEEPVRADIHTLAA